MSEAEGQVGAETFAAVTPRSRAEDNTNPLLSSGVVRIWRSALSACCDFPVGRREEPHAVRHAREPEKAGSFREAHQLIGR